MFPKDLSLEALNDLNKGSMGAHLGIEFIKIEKDSLTARMPVDHRTRQPMGLLHGGASVALAETLGGIASSMIIDLTRQYAVGLEINANHLGSVREGYVYGTTKPLHVGKTTQVWEIRIENEEKKLVCLSRITMIIMDRK